VDSCHDPEGASIKVQKTKVPGVTVSTIDKDILIHDLTDDVAISVFDGWCHDCVVLQYLSLLFELLVLNFMGYSPVDCFGIRKFVSM